MANTIADPMVLCAAIISGDDIGNAAGEYGAAQTAYEQIIAPLCHDVQSLESAPSLAVGAIRKYMLPRPRREATTAKVEVWIGYKATDTPNGIEVNGTALAINDVAALSLAMVEIDVDDEAAAFGLTIEVTAVEADLKIGEIFVIPSRNRATIPAGTLANDVTGIDVAVLTDDEPLSVHRQEHARLLVEQAFRQQYRGAFTCARWVGGSVSDEALRDDATIATHIEVPESDAPTATLTVYAVGDSADAQSIMVTVAGVEKTISCATGGAWGSETWSITTAPHGTSRPYGVSVTAIVKVDNEIHSLCGMWPEVSP